MAVQTFATSDGDTEIAAMLHDVFTDGGELTADEVSPFRRQLLDVMVSNADVLFGVKGDDDA